MSVGLSLHGTFKSPKRHSLEALAEHFAGALSEDAVQLYQEEDQEELGLVVHPAAEPVYVKADDREVVLTANTSSGGPGYHVRVVELAEAAGKALGITWDPPSEDEEEEDPLTHDETGYLAHRDVEKVKEEMTAWARSIAALSLDKSAHGGLILSMSPNPRPVFEGFAATSLGIRDRAFFERFSEPDGVQDFFAWWEPGTDGARYHRGVALALLWNEAVFREPIDDDEAATMDRALDALEKAHALDAKLPLPFDAWRELAAIRGREAPSDADPGGPRVGYRRGKMTWMVGPFTFDLDGDLAPDEEESDDEDDDVPAFVRGNGTRYVKALFFDEQGDAPTSKALLGELRDDDMPENTAEIARDDGEVHVAGIGFEDESEVDGAPVWTMLFSVAVPGGRARGYLSCAPEDRAWASDVLGSFRSTR